MFQGVGKKLDVAGYFVWRLRYLEKEIAGFGGLTIIAMKQRIVRYYAFAM